MKKKIPLIIGALITLVFIFFISGILQYLILKLLNVSVNDVVFSYSGISPIFTLNNENSNIFNSLVIYSKLLISISLLELGLLLLSKFPIGIYRFSTISSILFLTGYLIISFFYGIISALVLSNSNSDLARLITILGLEGNQFFLLIFFVLIMFVLYLHFVQRRVLQYLK